MHIIYPISRSDENGCLEVAEAIRAVGKQHGHRATVLTAPNTGKDALLFADVIKDTFDRVERVSTQAIPNGGWPQACNQHFFEAALFVFRDADPQHGQWLWHELDACPIDPEWCNKLVKELQLVNGTGKFLPFMGVINESLAFDQETQQVSVTGKHMVGVGIYPQNLFEGSILIRSVGQMGLPFDHYLQHEIVPHCHDTKLIAHRWGTRHYKWKANTMEMEDQEPLRYGVKHATPIDTREAVLVHGCKDLTLARQVLARFSPDAKPVEPPVVELDDPEDPEDEDDLAIAGPSRRGKKRS